VVTGHSPDFRVCQQKVEQVGVCYCRVVPSTVQVSKAGTEIILQDSINCGSCILENMVVKNYVPYFCVGDMLDHELWIGKI
jgi:hypothetical protein